MATVGTGDSTAVWPYWVDVWPYWVDCVQTGSSLQAWGAPQIWGMWCNQSSSTSVFTDQWPMWVSNSLTATGAFTPSVQAWANWVQQYQQIIQIAPKERHAKAAADYKARELFKAQAEERAKNLLWNMLTDEQRAEFAKTESFMVKASDGREYRLKRGWAGNIEELLDGKKVARLCIHPSVEIPHYDNLLAQKLLIETDPARFREIANRTDLTRA